MSKKQQRRPGGIAPQFPRSLHSMLSLAEKDGYSDVVAWRQDGKSFLIHDRRKFVKEVMPLYFQQTKFSSFRRQLNIYSFERIDEPRADGYCHDKFQRDKPDLVETMTRVNTKSSPRSRSPTPTKASDSKKVKPNASCSRQANMLKPTMTLHNSLLFQHSPVEPSDSVDADHIPLLPSSPFAVSSDKSMEGKSGNRAEVDQKCSELMQANPSSSQSKNEYSAARKGEELDYAVPMERPYSRQLLPPTMSLHSTCPRNTSLDDDSRTFPPNPPQDYGSAMRSGDLRMAPRSVDDCNPYAQDAGNIELRTALTEAEELVWSTEQMLGSLPVARDAKGDTVNEDRAQSVRMQQSVSTIETIDFGSSTRTTGSSSDPHHSMGTIDFDESNQMMETSSTEDFIEAGTSSTP